MVLGIHRRQLVQWMKDHIPRLKHSLDRIAQGGAGHRHRLGLGCVQMHFDPVADPPTAEVVGYEHRAFMGRSGALVR
jgi:hypothetical protein